MARAVQRTAARRDFIIHYAYLLERAGAETAKRFRASVEQTYGDLAEMPSIGSPGKVRQDRHSDVRLWPVRGFENYLIAYRPHQDGVAIIRLIHAKRDFQRVLGQT